jgi:hypothetical protein
VQYLERFNFGSKKEPNAGAQEIMQRRECPCHNTKSLNDDPSFPSGSSIFPSATREHFTDARLPSAQTLTPVSPCEVGARLHLLTKKHAKKHDSGCHGNQGGL